MSIAIQLIGVQQCDTLTLGLYGVKEGEEVRVQLFVVGVTEGGDRERLEVEQLRGRRELLREDEVAEGDGQLGLRGQPLVRHDADEVLWRERLEDGDEETDGVLVVRVFGLEEEVLVMEDEFRVHVFHHDPERLQATWHTTRSDGVQETHQTVCDDCFTLTTVNTKQKHYNTLRTATHNAKLAMYVEQCSINLRLSVDLFVPLEVGSDGQLHLQRGPAYIHQHELTVPHIHKHSLMHTFDYRHETYLVTGWMCTASSNLGSWWTYLWMVLPILGMRTSSPISLWPRS